jgi:uncharacterized membrane protein
MATFLLLYHHGLAMRGVAAWDVFCLVSVTLSWGVISFHDPYEARRTARLQDSSRTFIFVLVVGAATASLFAVGLLLGSARQLPPATLHLHIVLSLAAIILSWGVIHTLFALRYAHYFYEDAREVARHEIEGGMQFPGEANPDYLDFAYFSFVIGMTAQVSDVQITSRRVRRVALVHGLISFLFNTAILAVFVNIVAGLL